MYIRGTISFERPYRPSQVCYPVRRHNQHYPLHPTRKHYHDEAHIEYLTKKVYAHSLKWDPPDTHSSASTNTHNFMRIHI